MNDLGPLPHVDVTTPEYWDQRVKEYAARGDFDGMTWEDTRREQFWAEAAAALCGFRDRDVIDVGCGWGRFAPLFRPSRYMGVDFSREMVQLARTKNPGYLFVCLNLSDKEFRRLFPRNESDTASARGAVVFQVNSLRPMKLTADQFRSLFPRNTVLSFEIDDFRRWEATC